MSLTSGPIAETEQAGEKLADHIGGKAPEVARGVVAQLFELLRANQVVIRISVESK